MCPIVCQRNYHREKPSYLLHSPLVFRSIHSTISQVEPTRVHRPGTESMDGVFSEHFFHPLSFCRCYRGGLLSFSRVRYVKFQRHPPPFVFIRHFVSIQFTYKDEARSFEQNSVSLSSQIEAVVSVSPSVGTFTFHTTPL